MILHSAAHFDVGAVGDVLEDGALVDGHEDLLQLSLRETRIGTWTGSSLDNDGDI